MKLRQLCTFAVAATAFALVSPAAPQADPPTIVFGSAVSLTGTLAREGQLTKEGYDLWAAYVNDHGGIPVGKTRYKVAIKYYDDESQPETAADLASRLIDQDHVNFLLGPYGTGTTFTVAQIAERKKIPMVQGNGAAERLFNSGFTYSFGVLTPGKQYLTGIIDLVLAQHPAPKTVAVTYAGDAFSQDVAAAAVDYAQAHGLKVVYDEKYPPAATDVSSIVSAVRAANPDLILNAGHLEDALLINKTLHELNVEAKAYGYSVGPDTPDFITALGKEANDVLGGSQWSISVKYRGVAGFYQTPAEYSAAFQAMFHRPADYHNADGTAACLAFQYALAKAGTLDPQKVRDALASLDVMTFYGPIVFDKRGVNMTKPMIVQQIQHGHLVTVWPASVANAKVIYPTPGWSDR
jgi:branched-chain amino acid transport system substrate-binding protein